MASDAVRTGQSCTLAPASLPCYEMRMIINYSRAAGALRGVGGRNRDIA
jgi:hypothetical protein